ncbi:Parvovirus coat protein VP1-like protein [Ureibacillus sp. FSL K6-2830]|uniref:Parvovirus coat protein VP1-like protein n=1 Tax=Ureibacillus sp. FSL K6-2830 TaxID=2954610 RepID=UPI0030F5B090
MFQRRRSPFGFCYPGYRYCGPGCSGPDAPTNPVDFCCLQHDICYAMYGPCRYCDELFQQCLAPYKHPYYGRMARDARLFSNVMKIRNFFF